MSKLAPTEIETALGTVPDWTLAGEAITRTFQLPSFPAALTFTSAVGHLAERADHHPDIAIQYRAVTVSLWTHNARGLTEKDFALAREIDDIA